MNLSIPAVVLGALLAAQGQSRQTSKSSTAQVSGSPNSTSLAESPISGGTQAMHALPACAVSIRDQANPSQCLQATSVPTPGMLFPPPHDGGVNNVASGTNSFIGGGQDNQATNGTGAGHTTVGGGRYNTASGSYATVGGGGGANYYDGNTASGSFSTVSGGRQNTASGGATVGGGLGNVASGILSTVGGGRSNTASGYMATVGGGGPFCVGCLGNTAVGDFATVGGGCCNEAEGYAATVGGGRVNRASASGATVGGGGYGYDQGNTASGSNATVPGGARNTALGDYSFAAGRNAKANHAGSFVWGDSQGVDKTSSAVDEFNVYAEGGARFFAAGTSSPSLVIDSAGNVGIGTSTPSEELAVSGDICATGAIGACSDARFKTAIEPVTDALALVRELRAVRFEWDRDRFPERRFSNQRQLGFLAQDLAEVVPEVVSQGSDGYYSVDYGKLTPLLVRAIQEQEDKLTAKDSELIELRERVARLEALEAELAGLEGALRTLLEAR